jgi:hypothetical protein
MRTDGSNGASAATYDDRVHAFPAPAAAGREPTDLQMDQIRDLLFGEFRNGIESRLAAMEVRLAALEAGLAAVKTDEDKARRATFDALADGLGTLATQLRQFRP